jgi:coenzyme F420-reducing hydrogenase delta subunit
MAIENYDLQELLKGDSIVVVVGPKKSETLDFGMGDWSGNTVDELATSIKSFEIQTKDITTIYHSKASIQKVLKDNRKGFFIKNEIDIKVSE